MTPTYYYGFADSLLRVVLHEPATTAVPEALIHDVWRHQRFQTAPLLTVGGVPVTIVDPGRTNTDAGPDFLNAKLRLGTTSWTGAVEIHVSSGIWQDHGHDEDPRYNSTLLHVVLYHDIWTGKLRRADGTLLPELVLYPHLEAPLRRLLHSFYTRSEKRILCSSGWNRVPEAILAPYLDALAVERMLGKARRFRSGKDAEQAIYEGIFAGLGYAKNAASMRTLASIVPMSAARDLADSRDVEALFFGAAGLIPEPSDILDADRTTADYVMDLRDRFERLNHRFSIAPMPPTAWRFFRLRPANFPTLRIAQASALFGKPGGLLSSDPLGRMHAAAATEHPVRGLRDLFDVELHPFWSSHVRLEKRSARRHSSSKRRSTIGRSRADALIVNVVLPVLLAADPDREDEYLNILHSLPAAEDEITRRFSDLGTRPRTAGQAQAFHQLYKTRCSEARCLSCTVGSTLLAGDS